MSRTTIVPAAVATALALSLSGTRPLALGAEVLRAVGGVPAHLAGRFEEPIAFHRTASGTYLVFDRRAHAVYEVDVRRDAVRTLVDIGPEAGRLLDPSAFDSSPDGIFAVADAPNLVERVQFFSAAGVRIGGFGLPGRASARITAGPLVLSGVASLRFTGRSVLINQPETGSLVTEYGLAGTPVRTFGALRPTGQEHDRDLHLALNVGLPVVNPRGGFYFVFVAGEPRFRKYDGTGALVFERLVQGREVDALVAALPTRWPRRRVGGEELPLVPPTIRAAAADPEGRLWMSLVAPYTYVFDEEGDRVRVVQFEGAGPLTPSSFFFAGRGRLLVTPGLFEFDVGPAPAR